MYINFILQILYYIFRSTVNQETITKKQKPLINLSSLQKSIAKQQQTLLDKTKNIFTKKRTSGKLFNVKIFILIKSKIKYIKFECVQYFKSVR